MQNEQEGHRHIPKAWNHRLLLQELDAPVQLLAANGFYAQLAFIRREQQVQGQG